MVLKRVQSLTRQKISARIPPCMEVPVLGRVMPVALSPLPKAGPPDQIPLGSGCKLT